MHQVAVTQPFVPTKREIRLERKWAPWREKKASLRAELVNAVWLESELVKAQASPSMISDAQEERLLLEKRYSRHVQSFIWMSVRDVFTFPFALIYDGFSFWLSTPDPRRG